MQARLHEWSRRDVLTGFLRYGTLGCLGLAGAGVVAKRQRLIREGKCVNHGLCGDCAVLKDCGLPPALVAKESGRKDTHGRSR